MPKKIQIISIFGTNLKKNHLKIAVFGLGYVGTVNIACLAKLGHTIYGCDVKPHKVDLISKGKSTVLEPQVDDLIMQGVSDQLIFASTDASFCVENTEMALVCVGTPSDEDGRVNLNYIMNTALEIAGIVKKTNKHYTLVFRSTIPPGTIDDKVIPAFIALLNDTINNIRIAFLPEFLREGSAVKDFFECARIVVGVGETNSAENKLREVFGFSNEIPIITTNFRTAEFVKYVDNAYHATKVTFANEIYSIGSRLGVDVKKANEIFLLDDILNISKRYLKPGMPFGGSCLPKDCRAIVNLGNTANIEVPFFKGVLESNKAHQKRILKKVLGYKGSKVLICGLTFKQNTDDIRESPLLLLLKDLIKNGKWVKVFDMNLSIMSLRIEFPEIVKYIENDLPDLVNWADTVVINNESIEEVISIAKNDTSIVNCINNNDYDSKGIVIDKLY